ncbi:MAG TPA: hypothetical protein VN688_20885 [Gemmataceae bacterium]|nr:hypothetical protein [Gemmataceae bacterium]
MNPPRLNSNILISPKRQRRGERSRRWRSWLVVFLLAFPATAHAQSERDKPYDLTIVVHVAQNRLLTDVFRERIERELRDGFQAGLGDMGRVKVTHEHPRLADVLARGLKSLDGWKDRSDAKTHFVLIDFSGVHYEIQTRQYDGTTGRASPVVRRDRTRDRDFVAKATALLIKQDFGILGTVLTGAEGPQQQVTVELRGGGLGDLARWVRKDEVFALAPPGGGTPRALKWAILQVEEPPAEGARDGVCKCRFFHRYQVANIVGYHCIKLGTVRTALRLRWMRETANDELKPLGGLTLFVDIRRHSFEGEDATKLSQRTGENGVLETVRDGDKGVFAHVAFVRVTSGITVRPQVPVALVDDQPILIGVNTAQDPNTLFNISKAAWQGAVYDSLLVQVGLFKDLEILAAKTEQRDEIIKRAETGLKRSQQDRESLLEQKESLVKEAKKRMIALDTKREDKRLEDMEKGEGVLEKFIVAQKKIETTENDPKRKKWRSEIERAKLLEQDLEIGKAITIYEQIKGEGFEDAGLDSHLMGLRKLWETANAEHQDARNFVYRVWSTLDTARLEENLPRARKVFKKCEAVKDTITLRKMLKGAEGHADRLTKELSELHPELHIDDEAPARRLKKVSTEVVNLGKDIQEYLQKVPMSDK